MYDRGLGVLEQYGLTAETVLRGRGALICQTEKGWKSIREYWGSPGRLEQQRKIQKRCKENGFLLVDQVEENLEGQVVTTGEDGIPYVVKEWFQIRGRYFKQYGSDGKTTYGNAGRAGRRYARGRSSGRVPQTQPGTSQNQKICTEKEGEKPV